jgi:hypothetical protein
LSPISLSQTAVCLLIGWADIVAETQSSGLSHVPQAGH